MRFDNFARPHVRRGVRLLGAALAVAALAGCRHTTLPGNSDSYLIITSLTAASGAAPDKFGGALASDVLTLVDQTVDGKTVKVPTVFADNGQVDLKLGLKDPGTSSSPNQPSTTNFITVTHYHVDYLLADGGGGVAGVSVPLGFDGGATGSVTDTGGSLSFTLVRVEAKGQQPLAPLVNGGALSTIARITFFGTDQAGHAVSVTGQISVNFANWGDPS